MKKIARDIFRWLLLRPHWIGLMAIILALPGLGTGLAMDDYWFLAQRPEGGATVASPAWDLYRIWPLPMGNGTTIEQPWNANPKAQMLLFRPLTSLSLSFDFYLYDLAGRNPLWLHLSSLLWRGLNLYAVWLIFCRLLPRVEFAGLALMIYAFDDAHAMAITWVCARHLLIAPAMFCLAWNFHFKAECEGWKMAWPLSWLLWSAALFSSESAFGLLPLMLFHQWSTRLHDYQIPSAFERVNDSKPLSKLAYVLGDRAGLIWLGIAGLWMMIYISLGYGTSRQDLYLSPWNEPLRFIQLAILRAPALLLSGALWFFSDPLMLVEDSGSLALGFGLALMGVLFALFRWAKARILDRDGCRSFKIWSVASLCSALVCASAPSQDRSLTGIGIGIAAALALVLGNSVICIIHQKEAAVRSEEGTTRSDPQNCIRYEPSKVAVILLAMHLIVSPLMLPLRCWGHQFFGQIQNGPAQSLARTFEASDSASVPEQVVFLSSLGPTRGAMNLAMLRGMGYVSPKRSVTLISGYSAFVLSRPRPDEICLEAESGAVTSIDHRAIARHDQRFLVGQHFLQNGVDIEIKEVERSYERSKDRPEAQIQGKVRTICALWSTKSALEQAHLVYWSDKGYLRAQLPEVASQQVYPATNPFAYVKE